MLWNRLKCIWARKFARDQRGATAIEYGVMSALAGAVIVPVIGAVGAKIDTPFSAIDTALSPQGVTIIIDADETGCAALKLFGIDRSAACGILLPTKDQDSGKTEPKSSLRLDRLP